ncbi:MAG TPA: FprA family A-type flavoprotein [Candidatus Acidoferrum sp.]|nr:FprA family A-type flavoprotein [Candidatus Acidoferrum sp.]
MSAIQITPNVFAVGVKDPELRIFDIVMPTEFGTTYNAYLIKGEKVALIDTVKAGFTVDYLANIEQIVPLRSVDYLIINHTEPDHSGSITELLSRSPKLQLVCSGAALPFVKNVINGEAEIMTVKDDAVIDLGGKQLIFKMMPYMHWPDTMMDYLPEDKILFSCDGFAAHICGESIWDNEEPRDLMHEFKYYYDAIMRPFSGYIRRNLPKLDALDIAMIGTSHGPILRKNPLQYIDLYKEWTADRVKTKRVIVFFASNYGNTKQLAEIIARDLTNDGLVAELVDLTICPADMAREFIETSAGVVIGTPTFNGDAPKPVWDLVGLFPTVYSIGKKAAVFGSYGWGGEGAKLVADRLSGMKLKLYPEPYRARLVPSDEELSELSKFTAELAKFFG